MEMLLKLGKYCYYDDGGQLVLLVKFLKDITFESPNPILLCISTLITYTVTKQAEEVIRTGHTSYISIDRVQNVLIVLLLNTESKY